ncbi:CRISPR-associated protein Csx11 [Lujinxingia vulgaris]|uniref:CRISPR-associated protein Csx11 n=1 Tax=Lujinxingia vulgaris TaxID=2600176 RepID=A0A5C6X6X3_9DELT|nr:CRISPR-associated protein Csx11 [Lujinxingia vulgaris]TXD34815.1 CRISPR-associated protein Csx11 [Lujinxingia vulgaris]
MSTTDPLQTLRDHRAVLLACEALGWFHMAGKAHPDFLRGHGGQSNAYKYKEWFSALNPDIDAQLSWLSSTVFANGWPSSLTSFWSDFDEGRSKKNIVGLLQAAHAMASGIEKNHPKNASGYLGQDVTHMWRTSPFGHPERNLLAQPPAILQPRGLQTIVDEIARILDKLSQLHSSSCVDVAPWAQWREDAIGAGSVTRQAFLDTLAETRVPNNDVTLWDQSFVAAALFKSAVAGVMLASNMNWQDLKKTTRWRVLTVGVGTKYYEDRAVRIGDWAGAHAQIERFFDDVCRLIEVDLALGGLVYRDGQTLAFTFPGERMDGGAGSVSDSEADDIKKALDEEIDQLGQYLDTPPIVMMSESTRSFIAMTTQLQEARHATRVPLHRSWSVPSALRTDRKGFEREIKNGHTCPVCLVRRNGDWSDKQKTCTLCDKRRRGRLRAWLNDDVQQDTIWISEVADHNDRMALLTLNLGIDGWLDGSEIDGMRAQSIADWRNNKPVLKNRANPIEPQYPMRSMVAELTARVSVFDKEEPLMRGLQDGFQHDSSWEDFFGKVVEDRSSAPKWLSLSDRDKAAWLAHQLFRKNASPGRVHRFWKSAEAFFQQLLGMIRERASAHENRWRVRRLVVKATRADGGSWNDRETYHATWREAPLGLVYRQSTNDFVTITNLARCFDAAESCRVLDGQQIEVTSDTSKSPVSMIITAVEEKIGHLGIYQPIIPLELGPRRFRVLLPLEVADEVARAAATLWEEQFARVWSRLPLRVGLVAFPRMTPFQAVIEAARNIEDDLKQSEETWRVADVRRRDGVACVRWVRLDGESELTCTPTRLPDGRDDAHYPYLSIEGGGLRAPRDFQHPDGRVYRHVSDLRPGDGVRVRPSRLSNVFLDSTARRFAPAEVCYLSEVHERAAVWELVRDVAPSMSALRAALRAIEDARDRWLSESSTRDAQETWLVFVRAVLHDQLGARGAALDSLVDAARTGVLLRALRWQLQVLKQNLEANDD